MKKTLRERIARGTDNADLGMSEPKEAGKKPQRVAVKAA